MLKQLFKKVQKIPISLEILHFLFLLFNSMMINLHVFRIELFKASSILDYLLINFNNFYREDISENEYNNYTFLPDNNGVVFFLFMLRITL